MKNHSRLLFAAVSVIAISTVAFLARHGTVPDGDSILLFGVALTFPFNKTGVKTARFTDRGCLSCPTGSAFTSDSVMDTLERATANILTQGHKEYRMPRFPLANRQVRPATFQQMSINSRIKQHVFYPDVHRTRFFDPMPSVEVSTITRRLLDQCGGDLATAQLISNSNSLGCAPPRGSRGLSGKDRYFSSAATSVFELGPFCVTNYLDLRGFQEHLAAYKTAAIKASSMSLEYEKIRRFVEMSRKNGSAVAGTTSPRFGSGTYIDFPDSPGSFEWILKAIDLGIGGEARMDKEVVVMCSSQLLKYWINKYAKDHDVVINADFSKIKMETQGFIASFEGADFVMQSLRTNRRVRFTNNVEPVYVEVYASGDAIGEWDFQRYYVTEVGDDPNADQANGFRQSFNTGYGDPCGYCEGQPKVLAEQILIDTGEAFHYEGFPTNPLAGRIDAKVQTDLQALWGGTSIDWKFGLEVDEYYLKPMNAQLADTGAPCFNNIDNTWFAGRIKTGLQFVEDDPRQMMSLLVRVPSDQSPIEKSDCIIGCNPPDAVEITARPPGSGPEVCDVLPEGVGEDTETNGCMHVPNMLRFNLPCSENRLTTILFSRTGGTNGALTIPFAITADTALEGSNNDTDHFELADGNIVFADGEETAELEIELHAIRRGDGDPCFVNGLLTFTSTEQNPVCADQRLETILCFKLCDIPPSEAEACPSCYPCAYPEE